MVYRIIRLTKYFLDGGIERRRRKSTNQSFRFQLEITQLRLDFNGEKSKENKFPMGWLGKRLFGSDVSGLNQSHNDYDDLRINEPNEFLGQEK